MPVNVQHHLRELHTLAHYFKTREDWQCSSHVPGDEHHVAHGRLKIVIEVDEIAYYQLDGRLEAEGRKRP